MTRLIDADALIDLIQMIPIDLGYREVDEIKRYIEQGMPTVDAIPVSFIEKQINSAEWTLTHIGNSDYYGNTCEELSLKCYLLRSLINKWRDEK